MLRGADEILAKLQEHIDLSHIPEEYGGLGGKIGESREEKTLREWMDHNNALARGEKICNGSGGSTPCNFCSWVQPRSY
jgi:hypothetical protein